MLRRRSVLVVAIVLCSVLVLPLLNMASRLRSGRPQEWTAASMFSTRVEAAAWVNHVLYGWGISTAPRSVIVGRDGWLYLGDGYSTTVTAMRRGQTEQDVARAVRIASATRAWGLWLRQHGVTAYSVLVGPNKSSIYPEHLPRWASPAPSAPVDALFAHAAPWYVDARPALLQAKGRARAPLYYRTDTHWNEWGGSVAFGALAQALAPQAPDLRWPGQQALAVQEVRPRPGGDLANFLLLTDVLADEEPVTGLSGSAVETVHYDVGRDYDTAADHARADGDVGRVPRRAGATSPHISLNPVRVVSPGALNARKVLWLHDSFGEALAPPMAATFSQTLHMRWDRALRDGLLAKVVEDWRPDFVIVTVVEREALSEAFTVPPPGAESAPQRSAARP
jgi:hypothetical protein